MDKDHDNPSRFIQTSHGFTIAVPPPEAITAPAAGTYDAPVLFDDDEWASFPPCHIRPVCLPVAAFIPLGQVNVRCRVCRKSWDVIWDPWKPHGYRHAQWAE